MALLAYLRSLFVLQLLMGFVFVVSGLIINFIQLCTCVLWPVNRQLYRRLNCRLSYSLWSREYPPFVLKYARGRAEAARGGGLAGRRAVRGPVTVRLSVLGEAPDSAVAQWLSPRLNGG